MQWPWAVANLFNSAQYKCTDTDTDTDAISLQISDNSTAQMTRVQNFDAFYVLCR